MKLSRNLKTNLALAAVLAALAGGAYWYEFHSKGARLKTEADATKLVPLPQDVELESFSIKDAGHSVDVEFKCEKNCRFNDPHTAWKIVRPISFAAESGVVNSFLASELGMTVTDSLDFPSGEEPKLEEFGLSSQERAKTYFELKVKGRERPYKVAIGQTTPVGNDAYVLLEGFDAGQSAKTKTPPSLRVKLVSTAIRSSMDRPLSYWRQKKVFSFDAKSVARFELEGLQGSAGRGGEKVEIQRKGEEWHFASGDRADSESVDSYLTAVSFMEAQEYVSDDKEKDFAKLKIPPHPFARLTLFLSGLSGPSGAGEEGKIEADVYSKKPGDSKEKTYLALAGKKHLMSIDHANAEKFLRARGYFRVRDILNKADRERVAEVSVQTESKQDLEFKRAADGSGAWALSKGAVPKFDPKTVVQALDRLFAARALEFLPEKKVPVGARRIGLWKLSDKSGKKIAALPFYAISSAASEYYIRLESDWAKLERHDIQDVPMSAEKFGLPPQTAPTPANGAVAKGLLPQGENGKDSAHGGQHED